MPVPQLAFDAIIFWVATTGVQLVVGVASFRRSRCLSRYPIWQSVVISILAGSFVLIWLVTWAVNRDRISAQWTSYRISRGRTFAHAA